MTLEPYSFAGMDEGNKGQLETAMADFNRALQLSPKDADVLYNRGMVYDDIGDRDRAIADYSAAILVSPDNHDVYYHRALDYDLKGEYALAIKDYSEVIGREANPAYPLFRRGLAKQKSGDKAGGDADVRDADAMAGLRGRPDQSDAVPNTTRQ